MRNLLFVVFSLLLSACSAHNSTVPTTTQQFDQACPEDVCGIAKLPWQEILRRNNLPTASVDTKTTKPMSSSQTKQIVNDVYQQVMAETKYTEDRKVYNRFDLYPTRTELENARKDGQYRGDCTTFSHLFYYKLVDRGIDPSRILRVRMDSLHRQGPVTNHMAVVVDNTWLLDNNEPSQKVVHFSQSRSTPKMWLTENNVGWYMAARGNSPLVDTRFKGFSTAMF